jgi:beta-1,4-mannooligosaccharide/beta-1,4-mannosyl-N-acetylglucosamine phosphorylase
MGTAEHINEYKRTVPYVEIMDSTLRDGEQTNGVPYIYLGWSRDAIHWDFEKNKIPFVAI